MSRDTEKLIASLAAAPRPVRRLAPPAVRAAVWLTLLIVLAAAAVALWSDAPEVIRRNSAWRPLLSWIACLLTGVAGVIAAAHLATPDRSRRWAMLPLPFLAVWVGLSGIGCLGLDPRPEGDSGKCFVFLLLVGVPATAFLTWRLQRAHPMDAALVLAIGALGAAGLSAALLQFFHPFPITAMDLGVHLAAVALIVGIGSLAGRVLGRG